MMSYRAFLFPASVVVIMLQMLFLSPSMMADENPSGFSSSKFLPADSMPTDSLPADSLSSRKVRRAVIQPVDLDRDKPQKPVLHYYDKHGNLLNEPVLFLTDVDTVASVSPASPYPLYSGINIGANFMDAVMFIAGQKYASFDLWTSVSLHNWFFPVVEAGIGFGKKNPENGNFCYKAKPSPYFKLGIDYNFLYKSNPDYRAFIGLRAGFSHYRWEVTDIRINNPYWNQAESYNIMNQSTNTFYGEVLGGLQVKIYKNFSMGWTIRYNFKFHTSEKVKPGQNVPGGNPWFIPGYGAGSPVKFTFSLIWSIPSRGLRKVTEAMKKEAEDNN